MNRNKKISLIATAYITVLFLMAGLFFITENRKQADPTIIDNFSSLKIGTPYIEIEKKFGKPNADIGSGLHIFTYEQQDGSKVLLGFADLNSLLYVKLMDNSGKTTDLVISN